MKFFVIHYIGNLHYKFLHRSSVGYSTSIQSFNQRSLSPHSLFTGKPETTGKNRKKQSIAIARYAVIAFLPHGNCSLIFSIVYPIISITKMIAGK